ncbi:MAG: hypothetical protein AAGF26_18705 [Cyanobacteria bacterium P01_G01_bin.49]
MWKIARLFQLIVLIVFITFHLFISDAKAITVHFEWQGNQGYLVKATLNYDEKNLPTIITEKGQGKTNYLESLSVSIYNSDHELIETYDNIKNKIATGKYFQFNFNTSTKQLIGKIDIGGESLGELYLKGNIKDNLSLYQVQKFNTDSMLDQADSKMTINW